MKVIFLDIDGVLKEEDYDAEFKDECFARLKEIVDATGAEIILDSSWRIDYWKFVENNYQTDSDRLLDLYHHFEKYGLKISGRTDYSVKSGPASRPDDIRRWLVDKTDVESFCIIDDDDFYMWKWLSPYVVITRKISYEYKGKWKHEKWIRTLSDENVKHAIEILNQDQKGCIRSQLGETEE